MNTIPSSSVDKQNKTPGSIPPEPYTDWLKVIARYFQFDYYKTNFKTEILAGITTSNSKFKF